MAPGTVAKPHFALSNDHLRLHLGLDVPEPDAIALHITNNTYGWRSGKVLAFDDSYTHCCCQPEQLIMKLLLTYHLIIACVPVVGFD